MEAHETAAGESAARAAKLTSIREAVKRVLLDPGNDGDILEAIMRVVGERL
jgi:hypothetical protein